jgi:hypothetical protein
MPESFYADNLSNTKDSYLKLLNLISLARKNGIERVGETILLVSDLEDIDCAIGGGLKDYLPKLEANGLIKKIGKDLFQEKDVNGEKCVVIDCLKTWEEVRDRSLSLYNPKSLGLYVLEDGHFIKFGDKDYRLEDRDAYLLNILCKNNGQPLLASDIIRESSGKFTDGKQVTASMANIKLHLRNDLKVPLDTLKKLIPHGSKKSYRINLNR